MVEIARKKPLIFNPDEEPKDMLIATFVVRQRIFEKVFREIKSSSLDSPPQHFLLVGQRGMGKTTLLIRIKYAIEDDKELAKYIMTVRFPEEQYKIGNLADLWEETALYLENLSPEYEGLYDAFQPHEKENDYERVCFDLLNSKLKEYNKRILFLIDNIGDLLHKFTDQENHRFREILMTCPGVQLIGASTEVLEYSFQYDKPFFEFFYQLKVEPLNKKESIHLMQALAENYDVTDKIKIIIENTPQRIEALRRITGGVPRTLVLLFEIFIDYNDGSAFEDLEHLVDKVLPLYKARMDSLKPQQQKIIDALARAWEAISASEILEKSKLYREGITSNQVSSQLKQLEDNQLVEGVDTGKRKKLYRIRERFFNIWYLMRNGMKQHKDQVLWLIRFLESWCSVEELQEITTRQIENLSSAKYSGKAAYYKAMALNSINSIDSKTKQQLLERTEEFLIKNKEHTRANTIHTLLEEENSSGWEKKALEADKAGNTKKAESIHLKAIANNKEGAEYYLALYYDDVLKNSDKAEVYYLKAIEKGHANAMYAFAFSKANKKEYDKAELYYLKAIERGHEDAIFNLAILYDNVKKDYEKAELYYLKSIEKGHFEALNNIAILYDGVRKEYDKAEEYYLKAIEKEDINALYNLAIFYENVRKDYDKAKEYYLRAIGRGHSHALNNIAILYSNVIKDYCKAEEYFLKAIDKGIVGALYNIAFLYLKVEKNNVKAEYYFQKAISTEIFEAVGKLFYLYWSNNERQKALNFCSELFQKVVFFENGLDHVLSLLVYLIVEEQYFYLKNEFTKENNLLIKYMQPVYYVVAWYLKKDLPGEYEKAGSEIKETVDEIIKKVEDWRSGLKKVNEIKLNKLTLSH